MAGKFWQMNWKIKNACSTVLESIGIQTDVLTHVNSARLSDIALGVCMLRDNLITELELFGSKSELTLRLASHGIGVESGDCATLTKGKVNLKLSFLSVELLSLFLLKHMRDGEAEVDHLDFDLDAPTISSRSRFVIHFPRSKAPLSGDEARKILGI
jgi:hypothetical protein